jgi:hypothetical protein
MLFLAFADNLFIPKAILYRPEQIGSLVSFSLIKQQNLGRNQFFLAQGLSAQSV